MNLPGWYRFLGVLARRAAVWTGSARLGPWEASCSPTVWLHAASLGETKAVLALLPFLEPAPRLTLTAATTTGVARLSSSGHPAWLLPVDHPSTLERFLDLRQVRKAVFFEAEAWPAALFALERAGIPTSFCTLRTGPRSLRRWRLFGRLFPGWTGAIERTWTDGMSPLADLRDLGLANLSAGRSLKWAGRTGQVHREDRFDAALSLHLSDLGALWRLSRDRVRGWLWFPRRTASAGFWRIWARMCGLEVVESEPGPGQVKVFSTYGEPPAWLGRCHRAWVSPGHDLEEPGFLGAGRTWSGRIPSSVAPSPGSADDLAREVAAWILAP